MIFTATTADAPASPPDPDFDPDRPAASTLAICRLAAEVVRADTTRDDRAWRRAVARLREACGEALAGAGGG